MPRKKKEASAKSEPKSRRSSRSVRALKKVSTVKRQKKKVLKSSSVKQTGKTSASVKLKNTRSLPVFEKDQFPHYGQTQLVAFVKDPRCVFTYWEVTPEKIQQVKRELKDEFKNSSMVLRVFKVWPEGEKQFLFEIDVEPDEMNRYIELPEPVSNHCLEIAQKTQSGRYVTYVRSNILAPSSTRNGPGTGSFAFSEPAQPVQGLLDYYNQQGYADPSLVPGGISSAENQKRKRGSYSASSF